MAWAPELPAKSAGANKAAQGCHIKLPLRVGDKAAVEHLVSSLRDPDEAIRLMVRSNLRPLTRQKLGAAPAAWEDWWTENKEAFTPRPTGRPRLGRN
jgi:hypothetical protein